MPSRSFPHSNPIFSSKKSKALFLALSISACVVILCSVIYFLYHLWQSLVHRAKTIPFDSSAPLKLERFSYKDLKQATNGFDAGNVIGKGGSGTVFRGILKDGKLIAIKRLDSLSLQSEQEFQNELQILGGLRSPFVVTLLGYCVEKNDKRLLVYEYMPNRSLQESLFGEEGCSGLNWEKRFCVMMDVARALEFLHLGCDPPVIHGDIKPSNVLLDAECRGKVSDFGLSRVKVDEFGIELFSQDLGKSQELSGNLTPATAIGTPVESVNNNSISTEVDFALALQLQASTSSKNSRASFNVRAMNLNLNGYNAAASVGSDAEIRSAAKGKEISGFCDDWGGKFVPYYEDEFSSIDYSKELTTVSASMVEEEKGNNNNGKQWGKDWWWKQDGSGELCSKDYVTEWIGSQICPSNTDWDDGGRNHANEKTELGNENSSPTTTMAKKANCGADADSNGPQLQQRRQRKMLEWWKEEHDVAELGENRKKEKKKSTKGRTIRDRWKRGLRVVPHFDLGRRFYLCTPRRPRRDKEDLGEEDGECGEFSFRRGWRKRKGSNRSGGSDRWSGDLFSRELSSTTSMRGTLCYVAPEYGGGSGFLMEKADIYSFGVLILVIVSGRRPLHVLASPMKLEKANLISWCRHLAQGGNILELVDERLKEDYNKAQASLCINLALACLRKIPELRPDIGDIVKILKGEMELPPLPFEYSPSPPPSRLYSRSRRKQSGAAE